MLNATEKNKILNYLRSFNPLWITSAKVVDIFSGKKTEICDNSYSDGVFFWSQSDLYHIDKHNITISKSFFDYVC